MEWAAAGAPWWRRASPVRRGAARETIGTVITIEFFLTTAVSGPFLTALPTGHWDQPEGLATHAWAVAGLIAGGVLAAPLAGYVTRIIPALLLRVLVGIVIMSLTACQVVRLR